MQIVPPLAQPSKSSHAVGSSPGEPASEFAAQRPSRSRRQSRSCRSSRRCSRRRARSRKTRSTRSIRRSRRTREKSNGATGTFSIEKVSHGPLPILWRLEARSDQSLRENLRDEFVTSLRASEPLLREEATRSDNEPVDVGGRSYDNPRHHDWDTYYIPTLSVGYSCQRGTRLERPSLFASLVLGLRELHQNRMSCGIEPAQHCLEVIGLHRRATRGRLLRSSPDMEEHARACADHGVRCVLANDDTPAEEPVRAAERAPALPARGFVRVESTSWL